MKDNTYNRLSKTGQRRADIMCAIDIVLGPAVVVALGALAANAVGLLCRVLGI